MPSPFHQSASSQFEEGARNAKVRKLYQRVCVLPVTRVESLWFEYDKFENDLNPTLAQGILAQYQPLSFKAKAVARERRARRQALNDEILSRPLDAATRHGRPEEAEQVQVWRGILQHELLNTQQLRPSDLRSRIIFTYRKATEALRHYPEIWRDFALWLAQTGDVEAASSVFQQATAAMPQTLLMAFIWADWEQSRSRPATAQKVYEGLVQNMSVYASSLPRCLRICASLFFCLIPPSSASVSDHKEAKDEDTKMPDDAPEESHAAVKQEPEVVGLLGEEKTSVKSEAAELHVKPEQAAERVKKSDWVVRQLPIAPEFGKTSGEAFRRSSSSRFEEHSFFRPSTSKKKVRPLSWIRYMLFCRQTKDTQSAREVFIRARKAGPSCTYHVFLAAAQMEWRLNQEIDIAGKIFAVGFRQFSHIVPYIHAYLDFLQAINDHNNFRVVMEKSLAGHQSSMQEMQNGGRSQPEQPVWTVAELRGLWDRYVAFERLVGDAQSVSGLERRRIRALTNIGKAESAESSASPAGSAVVEAQDKATEEAAVYLDLIDRYAFQDLQPCARAYRDYQQRLFQRITSAREVAFGLDSQVTRKPSLRELSRCDRFRSSFISEVETHVRVDVCFIPFVVLTGLHAEVRRSARSSSSRDPTSRTSSHTNQEWE